MATDFLIRHAAHIIRHGGIIAYPTDTIYGLGCDPYNAAAVARLNTIKQRPLNKQFILLAAEIDQVTPLVAIDKRQQTMIMQTNEPTSWVADAMPSAPAWLTGDSGTITIRICGQDDVRRLCHILGHPIISTSANPSGRPPAKNALELHKYFHHSIEAILASNQKLTARPSKIIRLCDNQVLRQ